MANIYSDLHKNVQDVFNREGVELLSPHFRAQRDGSATMIPPEYFRPDTFKPHGFDININSSAQNLETEKK